ncbi:MAG TPA: hypothetical protein VHO69_10580 [Phototrophicaceae bacterium]|nr:hypothetical protein [Phototrophicaceae bacterium]
MLTRLGLLRRFAASNQPSQLINQLDERGYDSFDTPKTLSSAIWSLNGRY